MAEPAHAARRPGGAWAVFAGHVLRRLILPSYEVLVQNGADVRYQVFAEHVRRETKTPAWKSRLCASTRS